MSGTDRRKQQTVPPPSHASEGAAIPSMGDYEARYRRSVEAPDDYWSEVARSLVWDQPPAQISDCDLAAGRVRWFVGGRLNAAVNCVDRHAEAHPERIAIVWESDEPGGGRTLSYRELRVEVCRAASLLRSLGVEAGDRVAIYMGMVPEAAIAMLACARIGAVHSVIFGGFSPHAIRDRIIDCGARVVLTQDEGRRGGRTIPLKRNVDEALSDVDAVQHVVVHRRTGAAVPMQPGRDSYWDGALPSGLSDAPESMDAEAPLFILYTSGSTGKPKGLVHTQAGYLVFAAATCKDIFDLREGDVFACVADIGWITGHTYVIYGPLANGGTSVIFESVPTYPDAGRYWEMVERLGITHLYTAPTALRQIAREGDEWVTRNDRSTLRVLGTVGEPIDPATWEWYFRVVGNRRCSIVDTWWQTESGGILLSGLAGVTPMKPGSASLPVFGVVPVIVDEEGAIQRGNPASGELCIAGSWPGQAQTIYGDHERYIETYLRAFPGLYRTEDAVTRDEDGYYWITGRMDDVIKVAGHRLGTSEIEGALTHHPGCAEAAVADYPDPIRGSAIHAFVRVAAGVEGGAGLAQELRVEVRKEIGPVVTIERVQFVRDLPKTRSGKVMRRILRRVAAGDTNELGDTSTLAEPGAVERIVEGAGQVY